MASTIACWTNEDLADSRVFRLHPNRVKKGTRGWRKVICDEREEDREQGNVAARDEEGKWTDCDCTAEKEKKRKR